MLPIKVSSRSHPSAVAGSIAKLIRDQNHAELWAADPGSVNNSVKAIVLANISLKKVGIKIAFTPEFVNMEVVEAAAYSEIRFTIAPRK